MITKQKAIEILKEVAPYPTSAKHASCLALYEELEEAGAFPDEATLAEIASAAREILAFERRNGCAPMPNSARDYALRLATACRAAGLVKP